MKGTVLGLIKDMKYYFCQESVNMRKGIEGLCGVIRGSLLRDPFSMEVFVFLSRDRKLLKILRWNDGTFVLYTVKLYNRKRVNHSYHTESESYKMNWNDFWNLISNRKNCLNGLEKGE